MVPRVVALIVGERAVVAMWGITSVVTVAALPGRSVGPGGAVMGMVEEPAAGVDLTRERLQSPKQRRRPWLVAALAFVAAVAVGLGIWLLVDDDSSDGDANAFEPGTVTVSISGVDDAVGSYLAVVLYQSEPTFQHAVGGFGVEVDSDAFATSQVVREPQLEPDYDNTLFPYVSEETLVVEPDNHYLRFVFTPSQMHPYSRWVPADAADLRACEMEFSLEAGTAVRVSVTGLPPAGPEILTCPDLSWETISSSETIPASAPPISSSSPARFEDDEEWRIAVDDDGPGVHTVFMIRTFSPLREVDVQDLGGRLVWEHTEIELCGIGIRAVGDGFLRIGDIFQTTERCRANAGMQQAFDDFGPPETACVFVLTGGVEDEYCAPLAVD